MKKPVCVVVGVGPGNGAAFAKRFNKEGYTVALLARSNDYTNKLAKELRDAKAYECDVTDVSAVNSTFDNIQSELGEVDVVIYNAGSGTWGNIEEITPDSFETAWRINAMGLLTTTQKVAHLLL